MTTQAILDNVLAHRLRGESKHPAHKTPDEWVNVLSVRLAMLTDALAPEDGTPSPRKASKAAAQLAGLCVRLIEEMKFELVPAKQPD